jgi:hypothetical protein
MKNQGSSNNTANGIPNAASSSRIRQSALAGLVRGGTNPSLHQNAMPRPTLVELLDEALRITADFPLCSSSDHDACRVNVPSSSRQ